MRLTYPGVHVRRSRRRRGLSLAAALATLLALPGSAMAAQLFAAPTPTGSQNCTSAANACSLSMALSTAASNDEVIIPGNLGTYGTPTNPLGALATTASALQLSVHGVAGEPRPVIFTSGGLSTFCGSDGACGTVSDLDVELTSFGTALHSNMSVDHVIAHARAGGTACSPPFDASVTNTVCVADAGGTGLSDGNAGSSGSQTLTITLRNDTIYSTGGGPGMSILFGTSSGGATTFNVPTTNVILHGTPDIATTATNSGGTTTINIPTDHSDFATTAPGGSGTSTITSGTGDVTTPPVFVNAAGDDLHEAAGSPTIDAGISDPADGTTDLDGNPRTIGPTTDIGAYEALEGAPTIAAGAVSALAPTGATLNSTVDPNFSATTVQAFVGTTAANETPTAVHSAGSGTSPVAVSFPLSALTPGTLYHYRVVATNVLGTVATTDQTFTTLSAPLPGPRSTTATADNQRITLTTPSPLVCTAGTGKLGVSLTSTAIARSKAPRLKFASASFYLDKGVRHTAHRKVHVHGRTRTETVVIYTPNATAHHVPAALALKLAGLKPGTHTLTVKLAYKERTTRHGHRTTATISKTLRATLRVC